MNKTLLSVLATVGVVGGGAAGYVGAKHAFAPTPKNKTIAFVLAVEPGSECEDSPLLNKAVEHMTGDKRDASLCLDGSYMFRCVAGAKLGDKPDCQPVGDFRSDAEKKEAEAKAAEAKAKAEAEAKAKADAAAGSGSGSAK